MLYYYNNRLIYGFFWGLFMKNNSFKVKKGNEFFISVAKKGIHSFMMLGVIDNGSSPRMLARVGKTNYIDADANNPLIMATKALGDGALAMLADEGVVRRTNYSENIEYSAYSINYEQAKEFLGLIAQIEKKQKEDAGIKAAILNHTYPGGNLVGVSEGKALKKAAIKAYVPNEIEGSNEVEFQYKALSECNFSTPDEKKLTPLEKGANRIQLKNTCRSTALNIVEAILGFTTNVSKVFFISPDYKSKLKGGNPDKQSFYILPPPPIVKKGEFSAPQYAMLEKMHKRLENIPKLNPDDPKTRAKFDALKKTYNSVFGENTLSATALLVKLNEHVRKEKGALFGKRSQNLVSKALGLTSSTERMLVDMKKTLIELKNEEKELDNNLKNT